MSASDHLSPGQFFHASNAEFEPGDMVEPGHPARHVYTHGQASGQHVYAGTDASKVGFFGRNTYQVEPTGQMEADPEDVWSMGFYRSKQPLRVLGRAAQ
jgi:hypothetical protein